MNFQMISVSDMKIDSTYQRPADEKRIQKMADGWDDRKANLIHVSKRPDGYYVLDGNHTRLAYLKAGGYQLPCRVYEGLTVAEEARLFYELNNSQKKPKYAEILKAKAAAGCELEKTYLQLLDEAGLPYTLKQSSGINIKCHSGLIGVYKVTSYHLMLRALKVAKRAADGRADFYQNGYFPGLCSLIVYHPDIDDERLINRVKKTTASQVREIADGYKRSVISGIASTTSHYRKAFIDIYNKGLRNNRIEE